MAYPNSLQKSVIQLQDIITSSMFRCYFIRYIYILCVMLTSQMTIVLSSVLAQAYGRLLVYQNITIHDQY